MERVWELTGVQKRFAGADGRIHAAVAGVDLAVEQGERVGLIGASGSGKSTLARVGLGLLAFDAGSVRLFGEDTASWSRQRWAAVRSKAQVLFQDPRSMLNPWLPIGALLEESAALHRPGEDAATVASQVLASVGLQGRSDALSGELSGGERRRAGLARVLVSRPALLVADEPTAGLDAARKGELLELLLDGAGRECAVVLVSHDLAAVAWCCDRVVVMSDGRIVDEFAPTSLRTPGWRPRHALTTELLTARGWTGRDAGAAT